MDVRSPTSCDIYIPEARETVSNVHQRQLETAVPRGHLARVLLLQGPHAHQQAKLLERGSDSTVTVQLLADFTVVSAGFDDVAEYVGPEGEDE